MRKPRAPTLRFSASLATPQGLVAKAQLHILKLEEPLILLDDGIARTVRISTSAASSRSLSTPITGRRPINSGIRPYLIRSCGWAMLQQLVVAPRQGVQLVRGRLVGSLEAHGALADAALDDLLQPDEGSAAR